MTTVQPIFALVAGEASGDQLGAALIRELRATWPDARFVGVGGDNMRRAGLEAWWDSAELAVFGLFEVLGHLPRLWRMRRELRRRLLQLRPLAYIGIDAPDFNLGLEKQLKSAGIRTVHYVSPTVWAWRPRRVRKIAEAVDLVLCLFPFEPAFYAGYGVAAVYVGHPMADEIPLSSDAAEARGQLGLDRQQRVVALLPGSRSSEVSRLAAPMIQAAWLLSREFPDLRFVAAMANPTVSAIFGTILASMNAAFNTAASGVAGAGAVAPPVELIEGRARIAMAAADVVLCASGTATLEAMLVNRPMVSSYRLAPATYRLAKSLKLLRIRYFALPNILAGAMLVPELIQQAATGERLAEEAKRWLLDPESCQALRARFTALHHELRSNASHRAAAIAALLQEKR
ncbi:MAG: lipid-A-disaccharide synthase [Xanthomonadales bacterium]|nr:lipid-A-disaccharide synthase [Xanthomonadales bacterium]